MAWRFLAASIAALVGFALSGRAVVAGDASDVPAAEKTLRDARVQATGPALLAFFRLRALPPADQARLARLVRQLGADDFSVREKAVQDLLTYGGPGLPLLRRAEKNADPEIAGRARICVEKIEDGSEQVLVTAAARLLA